MPETERLRTSSEIYFINGTSLQIDVYINNEPQPSISDPASFTVGQTFVVNGDFKTPFQVYTYTVRTKDDPGGEVLAEASVNMELGRSYTGVFHWRPDATFQLSIYENDLSRGTAGRLTVRNTSALDTVDWRIVPNGENPEVMVDTRSGTLGNAEWQICQAVVTNDYLFEAFADGGKVTEDEDLDIGLEQNIIVHIVGAPYPTRDNSMWEMWMVQQELEYDVGILADPITTEPAPPFSTTDTNKPLEFDCAPVTLRETRGGSATVSAVDPDGWVQTLRVAGVAPEVDGFVINDDAVTTSTELGGPATGAVAVDRALPEGNYAVTIDANHATLAQRGRCQLMVTIAGVSIDRLSDLIAGYSGSPSIEPSYASELTERLNQAATAASAGDTQRACRIVEQVLSGLGNAECGQITESAIKALEREGKALQADLGCG